ncbi:MAG: tetratricopeptide repeat protein [Bacteroidetes bacterium]|jgi:Tfp pilus assembly protein PilF|nr:tetratricopeptide repeat protein [Bacteroidota bacterium]
MNADRLDTLLQFYDEDPDDSFTRFAIAQEYLKRGETEQALTFLEDLMADDPEYIGTYYHLAKLYEQLGRRDDALATYRKGVKQAQAQRQTKDLSELQDALMNLELADD